ncbi:hypothetical protein AX16_002145 [Volvariella volvacea WC 439]|nr:hypothetical protein AX16_002145 [Volvariella volvacea WC 439]
MSSPSFDDYEFLAIALQKVLTSLIPENAKSYHWPKRILGYAEELPQGPLETNLCGVRVIVDGLDDAEKVVHSLGESLRSQLIDQDFIIVRDVLRDPGFQLNTYKDDGYYYAFDSIILDPHDEKIRSIIGDDAERLEQLGKVAADIEVCSLSAHRHRQVESLRARRHQYSLLAQSLEFILRHLTQGYAFTPSVIASSRPKAIDSFAEKIGRKGKSYLDPLTEVTDLCGGRIITYSSSVVDAACNMIERFFTVDWETSDHNDPRSDRRDLKSNEFGYRSVHYIILFDARKIAEKLPGIMKEEDVEILATLPNPRAEIQVRTILSHAWSELSHDIAYKASFPVPQEWIHEFSSVSASLEQADHAFSRIQRGMQEYANTYGAYLTDEESVRLLHLYYNLHLKESHNTHVAFQAARLANGLAEHQIAIEVLDDLPHKDDDPAVLAELGVALIRQQWGQPESEDFSRGQECLIRANELAPTNTYILLALAETYDADGHDADERRGELLQTAYEADPADPAVLSEYLLWHLTSPDRQGPIRTYIRLMKPAIVDGIKRCQDQARVKRNVPVVYAREALFHLLIDDISRPEKDEDKESDEEEDENMKSLLLYNDIVKSRNPTALHSAIRTFMRLDSISEELKSYKRLGDVPIAIQATYGRGRSKTNAQARLGGLVDEQARETCRQLLTSTSQEPGGRIVIPVGDVDPERIIPAQPEVKEATVLSRTPSIVRPSPDSAARRRGRGALVRSITVARSLSRMKSSSEASIGSTSTEIVPDAVQEESEESTQVEPVPVSAPAQPSDAPVDDQVKINYIDYVLPGSALLGGLLSAGVDMKKVMLLEDTKSNLEKKCKLSKQAVKEDIMRSLFTGLGATILNSPIA